MPLRFLSLLRCLAWNSVHLIMWDNGTLNNLLYATLKQLSNRATSRHEYMNIPDSHASVHGEWWDPSLNLSALFELIFSRKYFIYVIHWCCFYSVIVSNAWSSLLTVAFWLLGNCPLRRGHCNWPHRSGRNSTMYHWSGFRAKWPSHCLDLELCIAWIAQMFLEEHLGYSGNA